jgi:hypothetical protein
MAIVRIRGEWMLTLLERGLVPIQKAAPPMHAARLSVISADRSRLKGEIEIGDEAVNVAGRVKPGNPGIVTLTETRRDEAVENGLEAILYIPPFWPMIDYKYDILVGTLTISAGSGVKNAAVHGKPFCVNGVKALA